MLTKYKLNNQFILEVCSQFEPGANTLKPNSTSQVEDCHVVVEENNGKTEYTTLAAKQFNLPFKFQNPKAALEQVLVYAYTGKAKNLKDMWFKIIKKTMP